MANATKHMPDAERMPDAKHILDGCQNPLQVKAYISRLIEVLDQRLFPLKAEHELPLKAALAHVRIPTAEPKRSIPFLRKLFEQTGSDKEMFLRTVLERLTLFTNEVLDFLEEIELVLPYNVAKNELYGVLTHGNIDVRLWKRLGFGMGAHDALNVAVAMGNVRLAMALEKEVGTEELKMTFDRSGAARSLTSLDIEKRVLTTEWLVKRGFFTPEHEWEFIILAAKWKKAAHIKYLLTVYRSYDTTSHKNALLQVALELLDVQTLDVLKSLGFISPEMITEIARPLLEAMSVNLLTYNERQETFAKEVALVEQWIDQNFPAT